MLDEKVLASAEFYAKAGHSCLASDPKRAKYLFTNACKKYHELAEQCPERRDEFYALYDHYYALANGESAPATSQTPKVKEKPVVKVEEKTPEEEFKDRQKVFEEASKELDELIGLNEVKEQVRSIIANQKINRYLLEENLPEDAAGSLNIKLLGNPGTGKTTVARILAKFYYGIGVLYTPNYVEAGRNTLVGQYQGQTAPLVHEKIENARDGVMFIDEVYSLNQGEGDSFGHEAIDQLTLEMDNHTKDIVFITAGYKEQFDRFAKVNPGIDSRFPITINFPDYNAEELYLIFASLCKKYMKIYSKEVESKLRENFVEVIKNKNEYFGNGRFVREYFNRVILSQKRRLAELNRRPTKLELQTIELIDLK